MADNNEEGRIDVDSFDFANEGASEETPMLVNYLITRLQQAMANPALQCEVQQQLQAYGFIPPHQEERIPEKSLGETSKRGTSKSQFEIARPSSGFCTTWMLLPPIFVGRVDRLKRIVKIMSEATKQSLREKGLHLPPWRKQPT
ncbi:hypothetical protein L7F22_068298 [Adiantum nelumboides]|nr:hypothetical protein [Adiantum nelumboides]